jgi:Tol biopolymer transport system component
MEWSTPRVLAAPVNAGQHDSYPWLSAGGTLFFFSNRDGGFGHGDIYSAKNWEGSSPSVENLGSPVNSSHHEVDPFIAPDESYLVFCSDRPGGFGKADIYVSFRMAGDGWSEPLNLGDQINTKADEYIPSVTPDGRYFFFTSNSSGNRDVYWMDAGFIEELRPK